MAGGHLRASNTWLEIDASIKFRFIFIKCEKANNGTLANRIKEIDLRAPMEISFTF